MRARREGAAQRAIAGIEAAEWLDRPAFGLANAVALPQRLAGDAGQAARNALHGVGFGHPLHPLLVTVPIGAWTLALACDALDLAGAGRGDRYARTADMAIGAGALGAVAAASAGLVDWQQTHGRTRRVGLVHAAANVAALGLHVASLGLRRAGRRGAGRAASLAGWSALFVGGYLGGHMVYRLRQGVDQADRSHAPEAFRPVLMEEDVREGRPTRAEIWDPDERALIPIVLVRHEGRLHALGARCSHMGGPLDEGFLLDGGLVCPWHGSRYDLETGRPLDGPSTCPQPRFDVRVVEGRVEVRRVQEPGTVPETMQPSAMPDLAGYDPSFPRRADEVLFAHHELLRALFRRIAGMGRDDPERRDLMRTLATELDIHETIEDALFYPAVERVSGDVPVAFAEHQELADLLAKTLKYPTSSPRFEEHLRALHEAVDHHASSEERSMFVEAQRLGEADLRRLGHALEERLEAERASRAIAAVRALKHDLLAGLGSAR